MILVILGFKNMDFPFLGRKITKPKVVLRAALREHAHTRPIPWALGPRDTYAGLGETGRWGDFPCRRHP